MSSHTEIENMKVRLIDISIIMKEKWYEDVIITFEDSSDEIGVNRLLYSVRSEYFRNILAEPSTKTIKIAKCKHLEYKTTALSMINQYFIYGEMELNNNILPSVIAFAQQINQQDVIDYCVACMKKTISENNYFEVLKIARMMHLRELESFIENFLIRNFENLSENRQHVYLEITQLVNILSSNDLIVRNEKVIFKAIKTWLKFDEIDRFQYFDYLMSFINFNSIPSKFLCDDVESFYKLYNKDESLRNMLYFQWKAIQKQISVNISRIYSSKKQIDYFTENFDGAINTSDFVKLTFNEINYLLSNDELITENEKYVCKAAIIWYECDKESRKDDFVKLLRNVRWSRISAEEIIKQLNRIINLDALDFPEIMFRALKWYILPKIRNNTINFSSKPRGKDRTLMVVGGDFEEETSKLEIFDSFEKKWFKLYDLKFPNEEFQTISLGDDLIFLGGFKNRSTTDSVYSLNLRTKEISQLPSMKTVRRTFTATMLDDKIYVCGGYDGSNLLSSVEVFDLSADNPSWCFKSPMLVGKVLHATVSFKNKLYVFGGSNRQNKYLDCVEIYDSVSDIWKSAPPMKEKLYGCSAVVYGNKIYVIGGCNNNEKNISSIQVFSPQTEEWISQIDLPVGLSLSSAITFEDKIYVTGGYKREKLTYEYDVEAKKWKMSNNLVYGRSRHNVVIVSRDLLKFVNNYKTNI